MPSPREIRRRIRSVRNMSQITRAMEMVAASKMRRAQERVVLGRPYADRLQRVLQHLANARLDTDAGEFPLLEQREIDRVAVIVMTPDRGLSGALNANLFRRAAMFLAEHDARSPRVIAVGARGLDYLRKTDQDIAGEFTQLGDRPTPEDTRTIAELAIDLFLNGEVDAVWLLYPRFVNTLVQQPEVIQVLPIEPPEAEDEGAAASEEYIFEPNAADILNSLLPRYVETLIYQAQLETVASFYSAQMVAMRNATDNAKELVDELNLSYNKARQAQITNEVAEISAGANAFSDKGERRRVNLLPEDEADEIALAYARGALVLDVDVSSEIDKETKAWLKDRLEHYGGREVVMSLNVDPTMIGGIRIKLRDEIIDGSVVNALRDLSDDITAMRDRLEKTFSGKTS